MIKRDPNCIYLGMLEDDLALGLFNGHDVTVLGRVGGYMRLEESYRETLYIAPHREA